MMINDTHFLHCLNAVMEFYKSKVKNHAFKNYPIVKINVVKRKYCAVCFFVL